MITTVPLPIETMSQLRAVCRFARNKKCSRTYTQLVVKTDMNVIMPSEDWWAWRVALSNHRKGGKGPFASLHQALIDVDRQPVFTTNKTHIRDLLLTGALAGIFSIAVIKHTGRYIYIDTGWRICET
jgi:hypothetical protein